jgi:sulfopyruvate decarboxylase subunit alpha
MRASVQEPCHVSVADGLVACGFGPFLGTPCGVLAPLYTELTQQAGLRTVPREDSAIGVAVGAALAGAYPVVLMQNSGLGQSVNALASLVVPYRLPLALVVSIRGIPPDVTEENAVMGRITPSLLADLGIETITLGSADDVGAALRALEEAVMHQRACAALLVPPGAFGWAP